MKIFTHQLNNDKKALLTTSFILSIFLTGCGSDSNSSSLTKQGLWEKTGYGDVFKVDKNGKAKKLYQFTRETCLDASISIPSTPEIQTALDSATFSNKRNTLVIQNNNVSAFKVTFKRLKKLPQSCLDNRLITNVTRQKIFNHFWHNFNDYYAFFDKRGVDWAAQYAKYQPQVNENMSEDDLFKILTMMVIPLKDDHVSLESMNGSFSTGLPSKAVLEIANAFPQQNEFDDISAFSQSVNYKYLTTIDSYLDTDSIKPLLTPSEEVIAKRATINHTIGYIKINEMEGFVDGNQVDDIKAVQTFMDKTMLKLQDTQGIIIDVRFNSGGYDSVSLAIANYFTDKKMQVLSKKVRYWAGETETVNASIEPANDSPYLHPVVVIANQDSVSAAESFLMIMKSLPQVTLIGENSNGVFSDTLSKALPNGWDFTLSNEVFYDAEGINYEAVGVPPQEKVTVFSLNDINASKDKAIEKAMKLLGL